MYLSFHVNYSSCLSDFNETRIFLTDFHKILKCHISWISIQCEPSCSMQMGRWTERHGEANSCYPVFCEKTWKMLMHIFLIIGNEVKICVDTWCPSSKEHPHTAKYQYLTNLLISSINGNINKETRKFLMTYELGVCKAKIY
jgi:hypothetical protein